MRNNYYKEIIALGKRVCENTGFAFKPNLSKIDFNGTRGYITGRFEEKERFLSVNVRKLLFNPYNEQEFIKALVTLFHEKRHIAQFLECKAGVSNEENLIEMIAAQDNSIFYINNYYNLPYELEAEATGVINTYLYLKNDKNRNDAFELIKTYIDNQIQHRDSRYINKGFEQCKQIDDVVQLFESVINKSKTKERRLLGIFDYPEQYADNIICTAIQDMGASKIKDILNVLPNGIEQSKFIAANVFYEKKEFKNFFKGKILAELDYLAYIQAFNDFDKLAINPFESLESRQQTYLRMVKSYIDPNKTKKQNNKDDYER